MPEFPVQLVPVTGGYALHYAPCDCPGTNVPGRSRPMAVGSALQALAQFHVQQPAGLPASARAVVRMDCARNVPMQDIEPMSWQERHGYYLREAAVQLNRHAAYVLKQVKAKGAEIEASRYSEGRLKGDWEVSTGDVTESWRYGYLAERMLSVVAGIIEPEAQAEQLIRQAEAVYAQLMADATDPTGHADPVARARFETRRQAAGQLAQVFREALSKVVAHRTRVE